MLHIVVPPGLSGQCHVCIDQNYPTIEQNQSSIRQHQKILNEVCHDFLKILI